ncbi:gamma-glutamyltransferase family protein [Azohydromonas sp. G-1-1-14]|uniref:Gamma-glutamyltransferase family protein n=2 Tax=Azohydromonas caseinilytica TaxID=2728836 RepID=A0A848F3B8_9BURK|nr:gamma-glutamyltransferase family protein [Azohydromonas caseinilytica]
MPRALPWAGAARRWRGGVQRRALLCVLVAAALAGCGTWPSGPSGAGASTPPRATFSRMAVAAAHPLAAQAGLQMLREGGSAVDAAVAVQMVLTLVEPQASGIGGGAFLLTWDGRRVQAFDGRERAPGAAGEALFLRPDGSPMAFAEAVVGGRSVGVPGAVAMLQAAQRQHGRLPWGRLFEPAIRLAEEGFDVTPYLHRQLVQEKATLQAQPRAAAYWLGPDGEPWPVGHRLRNPALAQVLRGIARDGAAAFYEGPVAVDIVAQVQGHPVNPGGMTLADLDGYLPRERAPMCTLWRVRYRVCGFPPPSSGHLAVMQMLGMLERLPNVGEPLQQGLPAPAWLHAYTEAARLAFADRAAYVADPDYVPAPGNDWNTLLDGNYLRRRAALVKPVSMRTAQPGQPGPLPQAQAPQAEQPEYGTSHVSIVDAQGRAVSMTTTIEAVWGSRLLSDGGTGLPGGFMLNNELTDFSFAPRDAQGRPVANRVQPGKRPRSSMSPTLVFDARDGRLLMSLGSPGGAAIIHYTAKTLFFTLGAGLAPQAAVELPNFGSMNGPTLLEQGRFPAATLQALRERGHELSEVALDSGIQALLRVPGGWVGGADPRREGVVVGE